MLRPVAGVKVNSAPSRYSGLNHHLTFYLFAGFFILWNTVIEATPPPGQLVGWGAVGISYVEPGTKFKAIAASDHNLALTTDGRVIAWLVFYSLKSWKVDNQALART